MQHKSGPAYETRQSMPREQKKTHLEALVAHVCWEHSLRQIPVHNLRQLANEVVDLGHLLRVATIQHPEWHHLEILVILSIAAMRMDHRTATGARTSSSSITTISPSLLYIIDP